MNTKTALEIVVINNGFICSRIFITVIMTSAVFLVHVANMNVYNMATECVVMYCRKSLIQVQMD